jgi:large subunit ribosomal protein L30
VPRLKVTQTRGLAGKPKRQRDTVRALGLRRIRHAVVKEDRPEIRGMIARVRHLLDVEEVE